MRPASALNLGLRVVTETGVVAGLAYSGAHAADGAVGKLALGIGAPLVGFGIWGGWDFRGAGRFAEPLRLLQELVISLIAAAALIAAGQPALGAALAAVSFLHHGLVYALGERLLPPGASPR